MKISKTLKPRQNKEKLVIQNSPKIAYSFPTISQTLDRDKDGKNNAASKDVPR